MAEMTQEVPPTIAWKRDYLQLKDAIEAFRERRLKEAEENVGRLLAYHLSRSTELLWAEVNGGLEDEYEEEATKLQGRQP